MKPIVYQQENQIAVVRVKHLINISGKLKAYQLKNGLDNVPDAAIITDIVIFDQPYIVDKSYITLEFTEEIEK